MSKLFYILFFFWALQIVGQENDTLLWNASTPLKVEDFKGAFDERVKFDAISMIDKPIEWFVTKDTLYFKVTCNFIKTTSWFKKEKVTGERQVLLLAHEQGHFDLTEVEVRKLRKLVKKNQKDFTKANYNKLLTQYVNEAVKNIKEVNKAYDKETNFSREEKAQLKFSAKIKKQLDELSAFSGGMVKFYLGR
jgi:hypothetical protein